MTYLTAAEGRLGPRVKVGIVCLLKHAIIRKKDSTDAMNEMCCPVRLSSVLVVFFVAPDRQSLTASSITTWVLRSTGGEDRHWPTLAGSLLRGTSSLQW